MLLNDEIIQRIALYANPSNLSRTCKSIHKVLNTSAFKAKWIDTNIIDWTTKSTVSPQMNESIFLELTFLGSEETFEYFDFAIRNFYNVYTIRRLPETSIEVKEDLISKSILYLNVELLQVILKSYVVASHTYKAIIKTFKDPMVCAALVIPCIKTPELLSEIMEIAFKYHIPLSNLLLTQFRIKLADLNVQWNSLTEQSCLLVLQRTVFDPNSLHIVDEVFDSLLELDFASCLEHLLKSGLSLPDSSSLRRATVLNRVSCTKLLLMYCDPHVDNNSCIFDAAALGYPHILALFSRHWSSDIAQECLEKAIQNDQPMIVEMLLKTKGIVKINDRIMELAMVPTTKRLKGRTCLQIILEEERFKGVMMIGKQAVRNLSEFVQSSLDSKLPI